MNKKLRRRLRPLFETRVRRTLYPIADDGCAIELTIDRASSTPATVAPLCEIELELKRGDEAGLFDVARKLSHALPARLMLKSKSERGYELLDGGLAAPVKAAPVDLPAGAGTRDGFRAIGHACLKQIIDNEPALLRGDREGVHQMRVGLLPAAGGDVAVRRHPGRPADRRAQGRAQVAGASSRRRASSKC